jgi:prepilin-type N-terminal cleavage/methylation domain-containing protein
MYAGARRPSCVGVTLIEVLVVIAIIGILMALLMPAVQSAREAARRTQCLNNLKQAGIALNTYTTATDAFPIGYIAWGNKPVEAVAPGWAWTTALLPYLEQTPIAQSMNVQLPLDLPTNITARMAALAVYICPSDRDTGRFSADSALTGGAVESRTTSYAANGGVDGSAQSNGLFRRNRSLRPRDVKDGLSNTLAVGERGSFLARYAWAGALSDGRGDVQVLALVPTSGSPAPSSNTFFGPHTSVILFLMADGSVRSIKTSINPTVYRSLGTRNGREAVDPGAY